MQTSTGKRLASALAAALSIATLTAFAVAPLTEEPLPPSLRVVEPLPMSPLPLATEGNFLRQAIISPGESLGSLLRKLGDQDRDLMDFVRIDPTARKLLRLRPGTAVRAEVDGQNRIQALSYPLNSGAEADQSAIRLELVRNNESWQAQVVPMLMDRTLVTRIATINSSLYAAADQAGIPDSISTRIPEVFGSDMDFHRDVRKGDKLRVVYELFSNPETIADGEPGKLLAVEYIGQEKRLEAVWFERDDGEGDYFNFDGQTLRKTFLRAPIEFTRISSGFTLGRRHPVLRDWRAHKGIDYVAPAGTKIRAVGDGQVEYVGVQRGYGRVVIVKHDKDRSTLYAHMSKFAPNVKDGSRVNRGEVIGYVGQTGWATGPHLHFEFLVNGEPNDPAAVMPPPEAPLSVQAQLRFQESTGELLRRIRWEDNRVAAFE